MINKKFWHICKGCLYFNKESKYIKAYCGKKLSVPTHPTSDRCWNFIKKGVEDGPDN